MLALALTLGLIGTITGCLSLFILSRLARGVDKAASQMGVGGPPTDDEVRRLQRLYGNVTI
jgi:hypothetical protein